LARQVTGRKKILVFSWCYHGTVDETFVTLVDGETRSRAGNVGPAVDPSVTTVAVEFNDIEGVRRALASGEIAAVLTEPALTNIGIVLPDEGFLAAVGEAAREAGAVYILDETHTFSAGWGGASSRYGVRPDMLTIGKSLGGGVPFGAYGLSAEMAERVASQADVDYVDTGGIGGTLAGNALSLGAARATLEGVFTKENFARMIDLATRFREGVEAAIERYSFPWSIAQLGARAEYRFRAPQAHNGGESAAGADDELDTYLHLFMLNRGVLMTPFHNMALMSPSTTQEQVDTHTALFDEACRAIAAD
ncbi:MAG: aminotransferase class III-fold pyridoxal phosphate-dependent enzyme, partial [Actinomycetota bacterium]|nr:aminotransferase class III-fold pyridoxal phosphate-dependent enzyme [Actinomycetota bacterium]